jgi:hypothetical protein
MHVATREIGRKQLGTGFAARARDRRNRCGLDRQRYFDIDATRVAVWSFK